jgi:predicted dehydrogenase
MTSLGIVGCGLIGRKRAEAARVCGVRVALVSDLDETRAKNLSDITGATAVTSWQAVIDSDVDLVNVAVTHDMLAPIALAAVEAGKHVLIEKPAGRTAAELEPLIAAGRRRQKCIKVGFNHRFHPAILKAKEIVDSGAIGPLMFIRGRYGHGGRIGYETEWRCVKEKSGGGELVDQGSHLIDLSRWFLGDLKLCYAAMPTYFWDVEVDDNCFLALQTAGGNMAWLHASWSEWKNMFSLEIYARTGKLTIDGLGGSYGTERLTYHKMLPQLGPPETAMWEYPFPDTSWTTEFQEFLAAVKAERDPIGGIEDAHAVLSLIDEAYARSNT